LKEIELLKKTKSKPNINNNTVNNNITINAYGSDKFNPTPEELFHLLHTSASRLIKNLVNENHFNKDKPENMNFYISNYHDNIGRVYNGEYWGMKNSDDLAEEVFSKYRDTIDRIISEVMDASDTEEEIEKQKNSFIQKMSKLIEKWERANARKDFDDNVKQQLKEHIYSKKDLVMNTHKLK
jgi:hypothetical protein